MSALVAEIRRKKHYFRQGGGFFKLFSIKLKYVIQS